MPGVSGEQGRLLVRLGDASGRGPAALALAVKEKGWKVWGDDDALYSWRLCWKSSRYTPGEYLAACDHQRINHFPKSTVIACKDQLLQYLRRARSTYGWMFDFMPESYILPLEYGKLAKAMQLGKPAEALWICKPADSSRGRNIFIVANLDDIVIHGPYVIQRYISDPLLVGGFKMDLRIYVLVTSCHPLTAYIYEEGVTRFGTEPYRHDDYANANQFGHLTNSSINKHSPSYNAVKDTIGKGCKWSLTHLWRHLDGHRAQGRYGELEDSSVWAEIKAIVLLTLMALPESVPESSSPKCFELFGVDIMLDSCDKPWLLEVNTSPSLCVDCDVDAAVKVPMMRWVLDIIARDMPPGEMRSQSPYATGVSYGSAPPAATNLHMKMKPSLKQSLASSTRRAGPLKKPDPSTKAGGKTPSTAPPGLGRRRRSRSTAEAVVRSATQPTTASRVVRRTSSKSDVLPPLGASPYGNPVNPSLAPQGKLRDGTPHGNAGRRRRSVPRRSKSRKSKRKAAVRALGDVFESGNEGEDPSEGMSSAAGTSCEGQEELLEADLPPTSKAWSGLPAIAERDLDSSSGAHLFPEPQAEDPQRSIIGDVQLLDGDSSDSGGSLSDSHFLRSSCSSGSDVDGEEGSGSPSEGQKRPTAVSAHTEGTKIMAGGKPESQEVHPECATRCLPSSYEQGGHSLPSMSDAAADDAADPHAPKYLGQENLLASLNRDAQESELGAMRRKLLHTPADGGIAPTLFGEEETPRNHHTIGPTQLFKAAYSTNPYSTLNVSPIKHKQQLMHLWSLPTQVGKFSRLFPFSKDTARLSLMLAPQTINKGLPSVVRIILKDVREKWMSHVLPPPMFPSKPLTPTKSGSRAMAESLWSRSRLRKSSSSKAPKKTPATDASQARFTQIMSSHAKAREIRYSRVTT